MTAIVLTPSWCVQIPAVPIPETRVPLAGFLRHDDHLRIRDPVARDLRPEGEAANPPESRRHLEAEPDVLPAAPEPGLRRARRDRHRLLWRDARKDRRQVLLEARRAVDRSLPRHPFLQPGPRDDRDVERGTREERLPIDLDRIDVAVRRHGEILRVDEDARPRRRRRELTPDVPVLVERQMRPRDEPRAARPEKDERLITAEPEKLRRLASPALRERIQVVEYRS